MNPIVLWRILALIGGLLGIGGMAYGINEHQKRKDEQAANRALLLQVEGALAAKEQELASLRARVGNKNEQVRILAAEVERLRSEANDARRAA